MSLIERDIKTVKVIHCPKNARHFGEYQPLDKCKDCSYCDNITKNKVKCIYDAQILLRNMHVTEFTAGEYLYKSKINESKTDDNCSLCCFEQKLKNENTICLLRHSVQDNDLNAFICYGNEYWIKEKIEYDEE